MKSIFLGLGSNVGNREKYIKTAIKLLSKKVPRLQKASIYESKAVGYTNQANFLNTVVWG